MFDATFLLSGYGCIYGNGCRSISTELDPSGATDELGCCIHGAHFVDDDDLAEVAAASALLDDSTWQHRARAAKKGGPFKQNREGDWVTRKVNGACIFLNRSDFPGGAGCALHRAALERGERPVDWKPDVCWQVPIRLDVHTDDYERDTVFVRAWDRRDWGPGGEEFEWWCTEEPAAFGHSVPVVESARDELVALVGDELYRRLVVELDQLELELDAARREVMVVLGATHR